MAVSKLFCRENDPKTVNVISLPSGMSSLKIDKYHHQNLSSQQLAIDSQRDGTIPSEQIPRRLNKKSVQPGAAHQKRLLHFCNTIFRSPAGIRKSEPAFLPNNKTLPSRGERDGTTPIYNCAARVIITEVV